MLIPSIYKYTDNIRYKHSNGQYYSSLNIQIDLQLFIEYSEY